MDEDALRRKLAACSTERALLEDDLARLGARHRHHGRTAAMRQIQDAVAQQAAQIQALKRQLRAGAASSRRGRGDCACACACACACKSDASDDDDDDDQDGPPTGRPCRHNKTGRRRRASDTDNTDAGSSCHCSSDSSVGSGRNHLRESMADLAARCHGLVRSHCRGLGPFTAGNEDIPRPRSDSQSALLMRCAAAEALIAKALVDHLLVDDPRLAATRRRWGCGSRKHDGTDDDADRVEAAVAAVLAVLSVDVFRHHHRAAFADALRGLFYDARGLWVSAQADLHRQQQQRKTTRGLCFLRAELAPPLGCWRFCEDSHALYGPRREDLDDDGDDDDDDDDDDVPFFIVPLFPQIVQYADGRATACRPQGSRRRGTVLVFPGRALWSRQRAVVQAYREAAREKAKAKKARARRQKEAEAAAAAAEERERRRCRRLRRQHRLL